MKFNIRTKLFLLLAGLTALILLGVLVVITATVSDKIQEKVISDFHEIQSFFLREQNLVYERLVESCYLIAENSTFKANVALEDPASVYVAVEEFSAFAKVDLFIVTDRDGRVLARLGQPNRFGDDLTTRASVVRALNGIEPGLEITHAELWEVNQQLYQIVSLPVYAGNSIIGAITSGTQITEYEAQQLKGESNIDITMFLNDRLIATTLTDSITSDFTYAINNFITDHRPVVEAVLSSMMSSDAFIAELRAEEVYAVISPLGEGEPAYYVASVPKALELRILSALQNNILLTAAVSVVITILLALFLGRIFSKPILNLVQGMNKVKEGDLSTSVKPTTHDEIGLLTQTFNEMIVGLRERLHLTKYVGSHTLEMIRKSSAGDVSLGGARQELAVLFSDIRGFTAYSENRNPEEVIHMLNRYLGYQAELVTLYGGSIDKFVGDEMVALFSGEDAVENALDCAIAIQRLIKKEHDTDPTPVDIGIGINYGAMILGNMGAKDRMDYTVIGSAVNLGARLCAAAGAGRILIPKPLLQETNSKYKLGQTRMMSFKGFSKEMEITEVLSD